MQDWDGGRFPEGFLEEGTSEPRPEGRALEEKPEKNGDKKEGKREKARAQARWFRPVVLADRKRETQAADQVRLS